MTQQISRTTVLSPIWRTSHDLPDADRLALFDPEHSELVIVNALGREVWRRLDGKAPVAQIVRELVEETSDAPDQARAEAEVVTFLDDLLGRGAIKVSE